MEKRRSQGIFSVPQSRVCSIDFTYTSHRTHSIKSYAPINAEQQAIFDSTPKDTNCIVTVLWWDGVNRTPSVLYTYNPKFRTDRSRTKKRDGDRQHLQLCLDTSALDPNRVVYVGKAKGEKHTYVPESPDLVRRFFSYHGVRTETNFLSDKGNAFIDKGKDVLLDLGSKSHSTFPPSVHHYLSPNENELHGSSKRQWRETCDSFEDDVKSCYQLFFFLDQQTSHHSSTWFNRNMIKLKETGVEELISGASVEQQRFHPTLQKSLSFISRPGYPFKKRFQKNC